MKLYFFMNSNWCFLNVVFQHRMGSKLNSVIDALKRSKAKYEDTAKNDIMTALLAFPDLAPEVESFAFPNSKRVPTFRLKGTIPVLYKVIGNSFKIQFLPR